MQLNVVCVIPVYYWRLLFVLQQLLQSKDLCNKAYGEKHLLACRLHLNIGILYEDNRDFEEAYDCFVKWNECCLVVSLLDGCLFYQNCCIVWWNSALHISYSVLATYHDYLQISHNTWLCDGHKSPTSKRYHIPTRGYRITQEKFQYHGV